MRVPIFQIGVGDRVLTDVFNSYGLPLIAAGTVLQQADVKKLYAHHVEEIDIASRGEDTFCIPFDVEQQLSYDDAVSGIKELFESVRDDGKLNENEVNRSFEPLIYHFQQEKDVVTMLLALNTKDDYTYQHSVQVGMLSYYIAKWLGHSEQQALRTGKAGYLHDVGKSLIDSSILQKPDRLTAEEFDEIKKHTTFGYDILSSSFDDQTLALVALQHHERLDRRGYPHGLSGEEIDPMSKIVAVADVYSAMISNRVYQKKRDLLVVLRELHRLSFGELDANAVHVFIRHMIPNFIGKSITLKDGRQGSIVMTNPHDYFRPLIRIDGSFIDLSHEPDIEIAGISA